MRLVSLVIVALILLSSPPAHAQHWTYGISKSLAFVKNGMTPAEVHREAGQSPWVARMTVSDRGSSLEWLFPTAEKRWTKFTFVDGELASRSTHDLVTWRRMTNAIVETDATTKSKLGTLYIGMAAADLLKIGLTPEITVTREEAEREQEALDQSLLDVKALLGGFFGDLAPKGESVKFDEMRMYTFDASLFYVCLSGGEISEMGTISLPNIDDLMRPFLEALAAKEPTSADFARIEPGMDVGKVVMLLGIPESEETVKTVEGTVTVMRYEPGDGQKYEVEVSDGLVVKIRSDISYQ